jgi:hypothetical protein
MYRHKSEMLNVGLTPKSAGSSSLYALSLILSSTLKRDISLDFHNSGKQSFLKCNQTKSPGSSLISFRPLLPAILYFSFIFSMFCLVVSCNFQIKLAHSEASKFTNSEGGKGIKSIGTRGLKTYTT